jgi:hypothetical protein
MSCGSARPDQKSPCFGGRCPLLSAEHWRSIGQVSALSIEEVGDMDAAESDRACPQCRSMETPILVVRGTDVGEGGLRLQCRRCRYERSAERMSQLQAS